MYCKADRLIAEQRIKELDEMRAKGLKSPLQIWWESNEVEKPCDNRTKWEDEETAFLVQHKPCMSWTAIADVLYKSESACRSKYKKIQQKGKLDYYMKYKLKSLIKGELKFL